MFDRRFFIKSSALFTLASFSQRLEALTYLKLELKKTNEIVPGSRYVFPKVRSSLGDTCLIEYKPSSAKGRPPVIKAHGTLLMSQKEDLIIDTPGLYRAQYLGPSLGWHIL